MSLSRKKTSLANKNGKERRDERHTEDRLSMQAIRMGVHQTLPQFSTLKQRQCSLLATARNLILLFLQIFMMTSQMSMVQRFLQVITLFLSFHPTCAAQIKVSYLRGPHSTKGQCLGRILRIFSLPKINPWITLVTAQRPYSQLQLTSITC